MKALDNRFYVKFMQLEIGLLTCHGMLLLFIVTMDYNGFEIKGHVINKA